MSTFLNHYKLCTLLLNLHTAFLCSSTAEIRHGCKIFDVDISIIEKKNPRKKRGRTRGGRGEEGDEL